MGRERERATATTTQERERERTAGGTILPQRWYVGRESSRTKEVWKREKKTEKNRKDAVSSLPAFFALFLAATTGSRRHFSSSVPTAARSRAPATEARAIR